MAVFHFTSLLPVNDFAKTRPHKWRDEAILQLCLDEGLFLQRLGQSSVMYRSTFKRSVSPQRFSSRLSSFCNRSMSLSKRYR